MKCYRVTIRTSISSVHKYYYRLWARNITHAETFTRFWDAVRIERITP